VCGHRGQRTRCGLELYGAVMAYRRQGLHLGHPHSYNYELQHLNIEEVVGKTGLTGEVVGVSVTNGVEGGNYS
jgi:hypothetical protein